MIPSSISFHGLWVGPYFIALVSVMAATLLRWFLNPIFGDEHPLLFYYGALAVTASRGGMWPALFSLVCSYLLADWFFLTPRYEINLFSGERVHLLGFGTFMFTGSMVAAFSELARRAQYRAETNVGLAQERSRALEREMDQRRQVERALQQLSMELDGRVKERTAQLETANKEMEAFSYSIAHDLRSPLRNICCFTEILREQYDQRLDQQGKEMLLAVTDSANRMDHLISDLLSLARVSRSVLKRESVDLSALAQSIARELQKTDPQRAVEFIIRPNLTAKGDEGLLRIALENLLNNAWKFTGRSPRARIEFGVETQEGQSAYFVRDNGAGFNMAHAHQLFGVFQRLHSSAEFPGTGIGLVTVERVIARHGGRIWAEGVVNKGATFYFTLSN